MKIKYKICGSQEVVDVVVVVDAGGGGGGAGVDVGGAAEKKL
jgi:hypothetical protein